MENLNILHWLGSGNLPKDPDKSATSGVVRAALEIARAQRERGHRVTVASVAGTAWQTEWDGVLLVGRSPVRWARAEWQGKTLDFSQHLPLMSMTRRIRYDVVHSHLYAYLRGVRATTRVVHFHADPLYEGSKESMFSKRDFDVVSQSVDGVVAVSRYIEGQLRPNLVDSVPIVVIPNGVRQPNGTKAVMNAVATGLRSQLGIARSDFVIVYVGAVVEDKGLMVLAKAFHQLWIKNRSLHLIVAGSSALWDGELMKSLPRYEQEVQALLRTEIGAGSVHLLGSVLARDMADVYESGDVVVVPSIVPEAFPLVCLEAMSHGLPVIASRVGGIPELIDETVGMLFTAGDVTRCAETIGELCQNAALRQSLGRSAAQLANRYTWERAARSLDEFYARAKLNKGVAFRSQASRGMA